MGRLDGKVAIVTGGGGGIGAAHARLLGKEGASVLVNDTSHRPSANAEAITAEIVAAGGTALANRDSATWAGADKVVGAALDAFGQVDILINNATAMRNDDIWRYSEEQWDLTTEVNLKGYFAMIRALVP